MAGMDLPFGGGIRPGAPPSSEQMLAKIRASQDVVLSNATRAALEIAENFVPALAAVRRLLPVDDVELISSQLSKYVRKRSPLPRDIQERVAQDVLNMRSTLAGLVEQTAQWIEYYEYSDVEQAASQLPAANLRNRAAKLISGEKELHVSAQSLRTTIELFVKMNEQVVSRVEATPAGITEERNLLLANAVLVYEIADFVVGYIESYRTRGIAELRLIQAEIAGQIRADRARVRKRVVEIEQIDLPDDLREEYKRECEDNENALQLASDTWAEYIGEEEEVAKSISKELVRIAPMVRMRRDLAYDRIAVLSKAELTMLIKKSVQEIKAAAILTANLRLAALTPARLNRLFGLENPGVKQLP
ncbi:MAG: hypothetical protein ACRDSR_07155 [Pseudonocardiaceae bacterium]